MGTRAAPDAGSAARFSHSEKGGRVRRRLRVTRWLLKILALLGDGGRQRPSPGCPVGIFTTLLSEELLRKEKGLKLVVEASLVRFTGMVS